MMMSTMMLFAQAATETGKACGKCPQHAIAALIGALVAGLLIGFVAGRKSACKCARNSQPQPQKKREQPRRESRPPAEPRQPIPAGSVEIYVGNLSYDLTEEQLRKEFEAFGKVDAARVVTNKFNDKSKGFGFVVMPNRPEAEAAIAAMSEKEVLGRKMRVNEARNTIKEEA